MYNTMKQAKRAVKDAGLVAGAFTIERNEEGKFVIVNAPDDIVPGGDVNDEPDGNINDEIVEPLDATSADAAALLDATIADPLATIVVQPSPTAGAAVLPEPEIVMPTAEATPFAFIWAFLAANPAVSRKRQIAAMVAHGINENTVKTQVSRYVKHNGDKAALLASEKAKRDQAKAELDAAVAELQARRAADAKVEAPAAQ
jgi:hypothetical protein